MNQITSDILKKFLVLAAERLNGDWVLIGGSVIQLLGSESRITMDIDLAGPQTATQKETIELMKIAESLGLPVESINQAGAFFLHKIKGWEKNLIEIHRGKDATFFRPNISLFLVLKIGRLTETDLKDCHFAIKFAKKSGEMIDSEWVRKVIAKALKVSPSNEYSNRLKELDDTLSLKR